LRALFEALLGGAIAIAAAPAAAHPHIFIDAKATIIFNDAGELIGIRNAWTFDESFSAWQVRGLDLNGDGTTSSDEMQELADENMVGLAEYQFYTFAGEGNETIPMASMDDAVFTHENGRTTLTFGVEPQGPYRIEDALEIAINDPEYYVAITFAGPADVTLENAPDGCGFRLEPPREMSEDLAAALYSLPPDVTRLPDDLSVALRGVQGVIVVTCPPAAGSDAPGPAPATALEAATAVAEAQAEVAATTEAVPFGGPPVEPGFVLPRTGFLGWIVEQQASFYRSLTALLATLKQDNNAFWLLGGLSFLYGVFHAAGPGHGKVVIGSYMLANERQLANGIALSLAAALLQAFVAIAFVLIAAAALNLSAAAMNAAANWFGIASYALVALLGLWLILRKTLGWGHGRRPVPKGRAALHDHAHDDDHNHHHGHDHPHRHGEHVHHDHGHRHVVTAEAAVGGWREQLGVVLAVGLRPCSGALVVLAFALSQGLVAAGIASVLLMGLGTAITVAVLATIAVGAKGAATRLAGANGAIAAGVVWWAELAGALVVFLFGALLLYAGLAGGPI
jgi:nickel/cobalt exporter